MSSEIVSQRFRNKETGEIVTSFLLTEIHKYEKIED